MILLNGVKWINYQGVLVPDEAPDKHIEITEEQTDYLLKTSNTYFIRWISDFDCGYKTEYWHVIKDNNTALESHSGNTRHNIRRGLNRCIIKKVDAEIIADQGYETYQKAFDSYDTFLQTSTKDEFVKNILNKRDDAEWEFWAVWNLENKMIAYHISRIIDNRCLYITTKFHPDYLKLYPSESLFFTLNKYYLSERGMKYVDDGPRSLSHKTNIQNYFIDKFNFRMAYCRLHIAYNKNIKFVIPLLYSFRKILFKSNLKTANKLTVLLKHEEIRRSFQTK